MSDDDKKDNVVDISTRFVNKTSSKTSPLLDLSDGIDDVLNSYLSTGMAPDMVAAVLANRLGTLLSAMKDAGIDDPIEIYLQIVEETVSKRDDN